VGLSGIDVGIFVVYILIVLAVGAYASRKVSATKRDYFLAGDKLPWWMIGGSIVAANISSHHFIGVVGLAYKRGFVAMTVEWGAILIGFNALLWIFLPFYLRNGFYTMPEFLERRFGTAARTLFGGLILLTYIFVEISAVLGLGAIAMHELLGISLWASVVALALFTGFYTILGGLRAVVWTEMLQLVVLLVGGAVLSVATIHAAGGWSAIAATSKDWHLLLRADDPDFPWTSYLGGGLCVSIFYCATNQFIVQRTLAAKNEWHARMGVVFTDYLKFFTPLLIVVPGIMAQQLFHDRGISLDIPDSTFPMLVKTLLPPGLVGLVMAGLIAAIMGHISGAINSCTTIATVDFYLPYFRTNATEAQAVRFGRIVGAVVVVLAILSCSALLAFTEGKPIFLYLMDLYGYVTPGIAAMFLLGILWRRTTHAGALAAGALTIPLTILVKFLNGQLTDAVSIFPDSIAVYIAPFANRTGIVFWACILTGIVVSLKTKPKPAKELDGLIWNKASLRLPLDQRATSRGLRRPVLWWAIVTAIVLYFFIRFP
jgi:solute:Na+ symporter, SSS family